MEIKGHACSDTYLFYLQICLISSNYSKHIFNYENKHLDANYDYSNPNLIRKVDYEILMKQLNKLNVAYTSLLLFKFFL